MMTRASILTRPTGAYTESDPLAIFFGFAEWRGAILPSELSSGILPLIALSVLTREDSWLILTN
jgi:hypothetical protein